ncbi:MAG TPA: aminoglycoside 6'-N-acetyltransferase [Candidatus Eremiobacteraceae bacterium]|nr:aminoglycoside 6'-N-acetyltransferase [Candidatus Eremiobacteraceae bacterium]
MAQVRIRAVESHDAAVWAAMRSALWPDADNDELAREARAFVEGSETILDAAMIAEEASHAVGFIEIAIRAFSDGCDSMPVPHVEGWYVEESVRSRGIGRALMRAAEDWARSRGFTELASDSELDNPAAQSAHKHCGFEEVDRIVKFRKALS